MKRLLMNTSEYSKDSSMGIDITSSGGSPSKGRVDLDRRWVLQVAFFEYWANYHL